MVSSNITAKTAACIGFWSPGERRKKQKSLILKAYQERISLRGLSRLFGIHRLTIARWIGEHVAALPTLVSTLLPAQPDDVLEFDGPGALCANGATSAGCGRSCVVEPASLMIFCIGAAMENGSAKKSSNRGLCARGPQRTELSPSMGQGATCISQMSLL